jgi:hypothetical protein
MVSNSFLKRFRKLDAYAKTLDDFRVRTATGGTGTIEQHQKKKKAAID